MAGFIKRLSEYLSYMNPMNYYSLLGENTSLRRQFDMCLQKDLHKPSVHTCQLSSHRPLPETPIQTNKIVVSEDDSAPVTIVVLDEQPGQFTVEMMGCINEKNIKSIKRAITIIRTSGIKFARIEA